MRLPWIFALALLVLTPVLAAHDWVEFQVYPENWCAQQAHSECCPVEVKPGLHNIKIALNLPRAPEGAWSGRVESNEVRFQVEK